jgi:phosphonate transport system substrate-binding protein
LLDRAGIRQRQPFPGVRHPTNAKEGKMRRAAKGIVLLLSLVLIMAMGAGTAVAETAKMRMAVTDIEGLEMLQREFGAFKDLLSSKLGMEIEFYPVPNRTAAVEAVKSKTIDFVLTGPAEYVVFKKLTNAEPVVGFSRPDYFCSMVVLADSGINSVKDLRGKKVAIGGVGSTSKHLAPMQILSDNGLDPRTDVKIIHTSVDLGWQSLKRGDVAAWGMTTDKFVKLRGKEKELPPGAFKVIARGPDLPNDVLLAATHVSPETIAKVKAVFTENSDALVQAILQGDDNKKYTGMKFLPKVKDQDYNYVRAMYRTIGYPKFAAFVE